jgi:DNA-binding FadR family transcriptional regulator
MPKNRGSKAESLAQAMLARIRSGEWPVGSLVPGERVLAEEFGASRVPLREAVSALRTLGVLGTEHGRGSVVRRVDATVLDRLLPLMFALEGGRPFEQVFELRLAVESRTAYLAAVRRTDDEAAEIGGLAAEYRGRAEADPDGAAAADLAFHAAVARATHNPLFPITLQAVGEFVKYVQAISCANDPARLARAAQAHESIAEAVRDRDPERARVEMEAHLRYSALRLLRDGMPEPDPDPGAAARRPVVPPAGGDSSLPTVS